MITREVTATFKIDRARYPLAPTDMEALTRTVFKTLTRQLGDVTGDVVITVTFANDEPQAVTDGSTGI